MRLSIAVVLATQLLAFTLAAPPPAPARIRVPVWIGPGGPPPALSDFQATLDGSPSKILSMRGPGDDLLLMVVLDMTEDLTQATLAKQALASEIDKLPPAAVVSVLRAQDTLKVLVDPTRDRAVADEAIRSLPVSGKAGLLDTVEFLERAGDAILARTPVRVAILYVTDSDIQNYRENFTNPVVNSSDTRDLSRKFPEALVQERIVKLSARLSRRQTPLFVVHLVYRADRLNEAYQSGLQQMAQTTAGAAFFCRSNAEVAGTIAKSFEAIRSHYSLTLALPPRPPQQIQVKLTAGGANGSRILTYRDQLALPEK